MKGGSSKARYNSCGHFTCSKLVEAHLLKKLSHKDLRIQRRPAFLGSAVSHNEGRTFFVRQGQKGQTPAKGKGKGKEKTNPEPDNRFAGKKLDVSALWGGRQCANRGTD